MKSLSMWHLDEGGHMTPNQGGCTFVLRSPPGFFTSLRGVTGCVARGLLEIVVKVLTAVGVARWFVGVGFSDSFFDVTTNLSR